MYCARESMNDCAVKWLEKPPASKAVLCGVRYALNTPTGLGPAGEIGGGMPSFI